MITIYTPCKRQTFIEMVNADLYSTPHRRFRGFTSSNPLKQMPYCYKSRNFC